MLGDQRGGAAARILLVLLLVLGIAFAAMAAFRAGPLPEVAIEPSVKGIGRRTPVTVEVNARGRGLADLEVAWAVCRHVKSNAIVLVKDGVMVGMGAGQPNRVESARPAVKAAGERAQGAALASDAFFPFPDGVERAMDAGVKALLEPGGSVRDEEVIAACDARGVPLVFTGTRHFKH